MKHYIILIALTFIITSCSKDNKKYCWECKILSEESYKNFGCGLTKEQIDNTNITDFEGKIIEKKCRIKLE